MSLVSVLESNNAKSSIAEEAFKKHEIVPDVISSPPKQTIKVEYEGGHEVNLGAELTPRQVKDQPKVTWESEDDALYTLAMIDADVSLLKDANRIEVEHWLIINIPGNDIEKGETLSDYLGSGPLKDTGLHRYIFLLFKQPGRIAEPKRESTNFEELVKQRMRPIKKLIETHNLGVPVAGNFFRAEFDDYVAEQAMGRE